MTAGFDGLLPRWGLATVCVGFLLAVPAIALGYGQGTSLRGYLEGCGGAEQPAWWPAFEEGFRRYASGPRREQNPLRRAVTRPVSRTLVGDGRRVTTGFPDVTAGGRP